MFLLRAEGFINVCMKVCEEYDLFRRAATSYAGNNTDHEMKLTDAWNSLRCCKLFSRVVVVYVSNNAMR